MTKLKYPIGIESFPKIIEGGYVYVDKTAFIRRLEDAGDYYFFSRPRRFGKSLFISTLEAYFQGKKELFAGLAIDTDETQWIPRPVFKFQLNKLDPNSEEDLVGMFDNVFSLLEAEFGKDPTENSLPLRFHGLLRRAYEKTGRKVAVLFDEYDAPLLATLHKPEINERYREILKAVFTILKTADPYIHFAFITGVSRFSHTSLFSGANNIPDISFYDEYAAICGITEDELRGTLMPGINSFAETQGITAQEAIGRFKQNYDGYHFSRKCPDIYNPFSLMQAFASNRIEDYWFETGTPTYLINALTTDDFHLPELDCIEVTANTLTAKESFLRNPVTLLYETGYLTIKDYDQELDIFTLGLPNREVERGLSGALLPIYSAWKGTMFNSWLVKMKRAVRNGEANHFMELLQTFLAGNPYSNSELAKREKYFKNNIYLIFRLLGFRPETEMETCSARADVVLETNRFIYIFELKTDRSAREALDQIEAKGYASPFRGDSRSVICIGANYSSATNNIDSWLIKSADLS